jgi:UDP-glucose 4-epimerase
MVNPTPKPTILVTGGAGYIGSHSVLALTQAGYSVVILDNLSYGHPELIEPLGVTLIQGDMADRPLLDRLFAEHPIAAVMHFAAFIAVGESVTDPITYYRNNVAATTNLLDAMLAANIKTFVFSSTCAIYGPPDAVPIDETHPKRPISPYATSKWMVEQILADLDKAYNFRSVCFRYFNAAGADPQGRLGEDHSPETHLIPLVLQTALGLRPSISILGTDYDTPDGTCIRDYIHVNDIAQAHILGLEYLLQGGASDQFNLGNGNGFSVREVIDIARDVTGKPIAVVEHPRREGDPAMLVGSGDKARNALGWDPQFADIRSILTHAWAWHQQRHGAIVKV